MICYITFVMLYNTCYGMLYNICYVMLYNMCYVVLYNICYVVLCYVIEHIVNVMLYNMLLKTESLDNAILAF